MEKNVFFNEGKIALKEVFDCEFPHFEDAEFDRIVDIFYKLGNFEDEGVKIRPSLFVTNSITTLMRNIKDCYKITMYEDGDGSRLRQRIKALAGFCRLNWHIYICYNNDGVEFGLIKVLNSVKDRSLPELIFNSEFTQTFSDKFHLININVISGGLVIIKGIKESKVNISFKLGENIENNWEEDIHCFVEDCCAKIKTKSQRKLEDIKRIYYNIFYKLFKEVHGTICVIVDKDFDDKNGYFTDGTWLSEPIEMQKLFLQSKNYKEFKMNAYVNLITAMLNYDGITVFDNSGRVRAYNIFIENSQNEGIYVVGGARKRVATTLTKCPDKKVLGVYFQSQDGDNFYKRTISNKRKRRAIQSKLI